MRFKKRALAAAAVVAAGAMLLAGCAGKSGSGSTSGTTASFNAAFDKIVNPSSKTGGTLKLVAASDCDSWDPARTYYGFCWNLQRLFTRSLMGYSVVNGTTPKLAPDLATSAGKHNADFTQWTYTLKKGLKFSTGKEITPLDVKYGVERLFATDVISGGPAGYFINLIKHPASYAGPYKSGDLSTITTTDDSITFNLSTGFSDFDYLMAMSASAPVPYKTEGGTNYVGATYGKMPVSSGPFVITSYQQNQEVVFKRNKDWSQSTDTIRHPKVDEITFTVDSSPSDIDAKLKSGAFDAKADNDIGTTLQTQVLTNAKLKANADNPQTAFTRYFSVMQSVIPNVHCRRAIFYATNKAAILQAFNGSVHGKIAGSMTPVTIPGHSDTADMYPVGSDGTGDIAKAKAELKACGKPNGFSTKLAYNTPSETGPKVFSAEQSALAKVGIQITAAPNSSSTYYSTWIGSPQNIKNQGIGIAIAGWGADFPTGYGFWQSIANGNSILETGNSNYPSLNDPKVNSILDDSLSGKATAADFRTLDDQVMTNAVYLPLYFGKSLYYRNPRLTNVTCNNALAFGIYDFVQVGVSS